MAFHDLEPECSARLPAPRMAAPVVGAHERDARLDRRNLGQNTLAASAFSGTSTTTHRPPRPASVGSAPSLALPALGFGTDAASREGTPTSATLAVAKRHDSHRSPLRVREMGALGASLRTTTTPVPALGVSSSSGARALVASSPTLPSLALPEARPTGAVVATQDRHSRSMLRADAALEIQNAWRRWRSKQRWERATLLQRILRMSLEQGHFSRQLAAAQTLQRWFQCWRAHRLRMQTQAVVRMQRAVRRWRERARWLRWREKQRRKRVCQAAAFRIQRCFRAHRARAARRAAATRLARAWRAVKHRQARIAAVLIQRSYRGAFVRRCLAEEGLLVASEERDSARHGVVQCAARLQLGWRRPRTLEAQGWALVVSAGGFRRSPLWRAVLEVSTTEAAERALAARPAPGPGTAPGPLSGGPSTAAPRPLEPAEVARRLLGTLAVSLSNGQLSLHLGAEECIGTGRSGSMQPAGAWEQGVPAPFERALEDAGAVGCADAAGIGFFNGVGTLEAAVTPPTAPSASVEGTEWDGGPMDLDGVEGSEASPSSDDGGHNGAGTVVEAPEATGSCGLDYACTESMANAADAEDSTRVPDGADGRGVALPRFVDVTLSAESGGILPDVSSLRDAESSDDAAGAGGEAAAVELPSYSPRAMCPLWCCGQCGFNNEVSPDTCVLCDARRDLGPNTTAEETAVPAHVPEVRMGVGRCASEHLRRLAQAGRHGAMWPGGDACGAAARPPSARPNARRRARCD